MYEKENQNQNIKIFSSKLYDSFTYVAFKRAKIKQYDKIQRARQAALLKQQKELAQKKMKNQRKLIFS